MWVWLYDDDMCRYDSDAKLSDEESEGENKSYEEAPKPKKRKTDAPAKRSVRIMYSQLFTVIIIIFFTICLP